MVEVVDSIIADLQVRYAQYEAGFKAATKVVDDHTAALKRLAEADAATDGATARASTSRKRASDSESAAAKKASAEVKAAVKDRANAERDAAKLAAEATKAAERDKQAALKTTAKEAAAAAKAATARAEAEKAAAAAVVAAAEREAAARARLSEVAQRAVDRQAAGIPQGTRGRIGATVPRTGSGQAAFVDAGTAEPIAAEAEINHLLADRFDLRQRERVLIGQDKRDVQDQIAYLARIDAYKRAGLAEDEAILRAEAEILVIEKARAETAAKQALAARAQGGSDVRRFAEGATLGYAPGGATLAGIGAAAAVAVTAELAKKGLEYAESLKQISDQLGLTTHDLQIYQTAAQLAGVKTDQFKEAFTQLSSNLGKAQLGDANIAKIFGAKNGLDIDIGNAKTGYKSLSDVLPQLIDRLSQIHDQQQRFAIETALGGDQLRKLDPILSGGTDAFNKLADGVRNAGGAMSDSQIQNAAETAKKLSLLSDQLQRDLSSTVSQNAEAIETLATAFFHAAEGALKFFNAATVNGNIDILNSPRLTATSSYLLGNDPKKVAEQAFSENLQSGIGRQALLDRNTRQLNVLNAAGQGKGLDAAGDLGLDIPDNPQARYQLHQQLIAERARILSARKAAAGENAPPPAKGDGGKPGDTKHLFTPKGPKGKSSQDLDAEEQQRTKQFQDELTALQDQALNAQKEMTGDIQKQAGIEKQIADQQLKKLIGDPTKGLKGDIDLEAQRNIDRGESRELALARAKQLKNAAQIAHDTEEQARDVRTNASIEQANLDHSRTQLTIDGEALNARLALAQTAKERLKIETELLKNAEEQRRNDLLKERAGLREGDPRIADINKQIAALPAQTSAQQKIIDKRDQGPGKDYLDTLPTTADKIGEAFERAKVDGLQKFNDGLTTSISRMLHLHGIAGQFLQDLIKIGVERELVAPIANALFGGASASGGSADAFLASSLGGGGLFGSISHLLGFADGGDPPVGRPSLVGERGPELFVPKTAGTVIPNHAINVAASNQRVNVQAAPSIVVVQPIHADFSGARTDEDTMRVFTAYADAKSAQARNEAIAVAGGRVSGIVSKQQTLGS